MPTKLAYRESLAMPFDDWSTRSATTGTITSVTLPQLIDLTTNASVHDYDDVYLYSVLGTGLNQQGRVTAGGFTAATGALAFTPSWNPAPASNTLIGLSRLFPVLNVAGQPGSSYDGFIQEALKRLTVQREIAVVFTDDIEVSLAAYADWLDEDHLDRSDPEGWLLDSIFGTLSPPVGAMWRGPKLVTRGEALVLQLNRPYTGTVTLKVRSPASTWLATSTVWTERAVDSGMTYDSDQALPSTTEVVTVARWLMYQALHERGHGLPSGDYTTLLPALQAAAEALPSYDPTYKATAPPQSAQAAA